MYAFVFPGQGSQFVGMGKEFYTNFSVARDIFAEVDEALSQHLSRLILEGPGSELNLTENTQPALMTVSLAIARVLEQEGGFSLPHKARLVAGHSLGEYTAIAAAGGWSVADTARLLRIRGAAMQKAVPIGHGGMAAILGVDLEQAQQLADHAAQNQICSIANDNCPGQVVLSGHKEAIDRAIQAAKEYGATRAVALTVSAPFHCSLMSPAAEVMRDALTATSLQDLTVSLIANVSADEVKDADAIRQLLVDQVTGRVRWRESVACFAEKGIQKVIEIGAGKVLTGLTKRIDPSLEGINLNVPEDINEFLNRL